MSEEYTPFADLPAALVEELMGQTKSVGETLLEGFQNIKAKREIFRQELNEKGFIQHESSLGYPPLPTTCATDGSYAIERLLAIDLVASAAVAVEGLTPPSEKRYWEKPHHLSYINTEIHHPDSATILRAIMLGNELLLATKAPHDLVMIDGTLTLPIIYFNQAINKALNEGRDLICSQYFLENIVNYLVAYRDILKAARSDKSYVGLPKYSTRCEIGKTMEWTTSYDDRGLLSLLLKAGEFTTPIYLEQPEQEWHLHTKNLPSEVSNLASKLSSEIINYLKNIHIFYYKPHDWIPALRIETAENIANNRHRLAIVIYGIKHQCAVSGMLEPYPLYLADRSVKAMSRAVPAIRQVVTQQMSESYDGDVGEVFLTMHGYRSESGV